MGPYQYTRVFLVMLVTFIYSTEAETLVTWSEVHQICHNHFNTFNRWQDLNRLPQQLIKIGDYKVCKCLYHRDSIEVRYLLQT